MTLPKSPSALLAYNRRITRLVYLVIVVIVLVALLAGFFGAYTKTGGARISDRPTMRRSLRMSPGKELEGKDHRSAAVQIESIDELAGRIEKQDLFEALQLAQKGLREPRVAYSKMDYKEVHFAMVHDGPIVEDTMKYFRAFVGVGMCSLTVPLSFIGPA